jgi:hypothetical protein
MNRRKAAAFLLIVTLVALAVFFPSSAEASFYFHIPKQQDQLTINDNGSVTLVRYFDFFVEASSTDAGTEIWAGLPTSSTRVTSVVDDDGNKVDFNVRSSGGEYVVTLKGFSIKPGTGMGFTVTAEIPNFIFPDTRNEGYVTMQYFPAWWSSTVKTQDIAVILPGAVEKSEIRTGSRLWDGIAQTEEGAYVVTWQFSDLKANEKVSINIGFPEKYVTLPVKEDPRPTPIAPGIPGFSDNRGLDPLIGVFGMIFVAGIVMAVIRANNREAYSSPEVRMEGVGVNETLSPVEVSILLKQPPEKTLTLLLFNLVKKGVLRVTSTEPLRVSVDNTKNLEEAERLFVEAVDRFTGEIDPKKLIPCFRYLAVALNEKLKPYCRRDTEEFYRGLIRQMWDEVTAAGTPELKLEAMDRNMLWLLQDEDRMQAAEEEFPRDRTADALPNWWLYGFMFNRPFGYMYYMWPGSIFGQYSGIYGGLIGDRQEDFREVTEEVFRPAVPPTRFFGTGGGARSGRGGGGGFTPPSCACACACVSCACACACAGGGGCT